MSDNTEKILSKVRLLLNLANDSGATESEAMVAMEKALQLLSQYNLEIEDAVENAKIIRDRWFSGKRNREQWVCTIYASAAKLYFCHYYSGKAYDEMNYDFTLCHTWIGEDQNIAVAKQFAFYLEKIVRRMVDEQCRGKGRTIRDSYSRGIADRIWKRVHDRIHNVQENHAAGTATGTDLVLADQYTRASSLIQQFLESEGIKLKTSKSRPVIREVYQDGLKAGDTVNLNRPIETKETHLLTGV